MLMILPYFFKHHDIETLQNIINVALPKITKWMEANYLTLNTTKTLLQIYSTRKSKAMLDVRINNVEIKETNTVKYLGILIDSNMKFESHINSITNIVSRNIDIIARTRQFVARKQLIQMYNSLIYPYINYCCFICGSGYENQIRKLVILQKRAMRIIEGITPP